MTLFKRNAGFINANVQSKISETTLLFAGCGIGSQIAIAAARMGFKKFILIDGDEIDCSNLNRQAYDFADIGRKKVVALSEKLRNINPEAQVETIDSWLTKDNVRSLVEKTDLIIDTIDFLDLGAILALHDCANELNKKLLSGFSAGWGACLIYIKPDPREQSLMRKAFQIPTNTTETHREFSYIKTFETFVGRIFDLLPFKVQKDMLLVIKKMKDNETCPASHVIAGAFTVAAMATTALYKIISEENINNKGHLLITDFEKILSADGHSLIPATPNSV